MYSSRIVTPIFSLDSDPAFSTSELATIIDIWRAVSEDYAPWDIDVTTGAAAAGARGRASAHLVVRGMQVLCVPWAHNPCASAGLPPALHLGPLLDPSPSVLCAAETPTRSLAGYGQRVAIGGNWTDWVGSQCGGITLLGTFGSRAAGDGSTNSPPATSNETPPLFVFPQRLNHDVKERGWGEGRGVGLGGLGLGPQALHFISHRKARGPHPPPQFIWEVVSHEVGHAFGLV